MPANGSKPAVAARAWIVLSILTLVYVISFIDRQILSILAENIKLDLGLTDAELGFLYGTAFAIFYALFGIPLGRLADKWNRVWLIAAGLLGWSLMTSLSGFATSFAILAIARIGVGVGEASTSPAAYSLIADYFPEHRRATALSIYASGLYIGLGLSLPVGGFLMAFWQDAFATAADAPFGLAAWQGTFLLLGIPGLFVALLVLSIKDPSPRSATASAPFRQFGQELFSIIPPFTLFLASRRKGELKINLLILGGVAAMAALLTIMTGDVAQWIVYGVGIYAIGSWVQALRYRDRPTYLLLWRTPIAVGLTFAFGSLAFITYSTGFWASPYALRTFYPAPGAPAALVGGMTAVQEVSMFVGAGSALGSAIGVIIGGMIADRWRRNDPRGRLFTVAGSLVFSIPIVVTAFSVHSLPLFFALIALSTIASSAWSGAAIATIQDLVLPGMRATAGATFLLGMTVVGLALGPYIAGKIGTMTGSLRYGIFWLYAVAPFTLAITWWASRHLSEVESTRQLRAKAI